MDGLWCDVTHKPMTNDFDYYEIFPWDTTMLYSSKGWPEVRDNQGQ